MSIVNLDGRLICDTGEQAATVARHLQEHARLSRAEAGCLRFEVSATRDPLIWEVSESFASREAFDAHQARVAASAWGAATAGIRREYAVAEAEAEAEPDARG